MMLEVAAKPNKEEALLAVSFSTRTIFGSTHLTLHLEFFLGITTRRSYINFS
jgi:hypothetical protein